jgi:hypothetical protein
VTALTLENTEGRITTSTYASAVYDKSLMRHRELKKAVEPHIKQEDEGKYRCRTCLKLFKAGSFVEKHIVNKHPEHVKALDEVRKLLGWLWYNVRLTRFSVATFLQQFCSRPPSHSTLCAFAAALVWK